MIKALMHTRSALSFICVCLVTCMMLSFGGIEVYAAATTVTFHEGDLLVYGPGGKDAVSIRWVTHIDGEPVDLDDVPGVSRSYVYCIQPGVTNPPDGTYNVTIVDDEGTGRNARLRKMIYYLPGAYGYSKVTKKRWFSDGELDYAIGHMALSYINWGDRIWSDRGDTIKSKVLQIVDDLDNLPDPPDDFEIFWIQNEGYQDLFGAFYKKEFGKLSVKKQSKIAATVNGNPNYSLAGAEYTLYEDAACTQIAKTETGSNAVLRTKADGTTDSIDIETGTYYIKETKAPPGYALDSKVSTVEVDKDKTTTFTAQEIPKSNSVSKLIQKVDKETGLARAQGGASLAGAEYTVKFYAVKVQSGMSATQMAEAVRSKNPADINGKSAVWVFRTDESGAVDMSQPDKYLVRDRSADLFCNSAGKPALPMGIISVQETKAPTGYLIDSTVRYAAVTESGGAENLSTLAAFVGNNSLKEQVIRGDLSLNKAAEGRKRMAGIPFRFTSLTTGESHVLITDKNGFLSTVSSWNPHDNATNEGTSDEDGIWFNGYNDESTGAKVNNSLGALPYDTYKMEELRSEANEGYELIEDEISIIRDKTNIDLGTYDDAKVVEPKLATRAKDKESDTSEAEADDEITIVDEISYSNIRPGKDYVIEGVLMDKATGEALLDDDGNEIRGSTEFYAEEENGTIEVEFKLKGSTLGGKDAVAFEYLKHEGEEIAKHADINSKSQTVSIKDTPAPEEPPLKEDPPAEENPPIEDYPPLEESPPKNEEPPTTPSPPDRPHSPETGDRGMSLIYYTFIMMLAAELLLLTVKHRNDRLN